MHNITVSSSIAWLFIAVVESNSVLFKSCFWSPLRWFCIEMNKLGINHKCTKGVTPEQMAGCDYCLWSNFADCANHPKSFPRPPPHTHLLSRAALHTASDYMTECRIMVRGWFSKWEVHNDSPLPIKRRAGLYRCLTSWCVTTITRGQFFFGGVGVAWVAELVLILLCEGKP